jgi:tetratricopeptide (TPR) repeat protein
MASRTEIEVQAAMAAVVSEHASPGEKVDMLVEIAMGLQTRPETMHDLESAVRLYQEALSLCADDQAALRARIEARKGTAYLAIPSNGPDMLEAARDCFDRARPVLQQLGSPEEMAELEMNIGLVLQSLAGLRRAKITDAIAAYQRALRTFNKAAHPKEFAILQNNLATAFLSIPMTDERARMREAMAVQAFEEGLRVVDIVEHPSEYAMLQNNLGNALQYASSSHAVENNLRALEAYDEALKVRTAATTPVEYANTIANKANCLLNLPDDPESPEAGNARNMSEARRLYQEAYAIFSTRGESDKAAAVADVLREIGGAMLLGGEHGGSAQPSTSPGNGVAAE